MSRSRNVGSFNGRAKLTEENVLKIRTMFKEGTSMQNLSKMYNVTVRCIHYAVRRKTWKHVR